MVAAYHLYRGPAEYDLLTRVQMSFDQLLERGWNYAWWIFEGILRDRYSHTNAAAIGWQFVPDPVDALFYNWIDAKAQMSRQKNQVAPAPVQRPWAVKSASESRSRRFDIASVQRRRKIAEHLGL